MKTTIIKYSIFILVFLLSGHLYAQQMMFGDTSRIGAPFAKDPQVLNFKGSYWMYYSIPPLKDDPNSGWNIAIAKSQDLINWEKVGEITPQAGAIYEQKGLCAPGGIVRNDTIHLFYQTYGNQKKDAICHAYSTDGINFTRNKTNPIFHPTGQWTCGRAIDAEVCFFKGEYFLYFATRDTDFEKQILGVAKSPKGSNFDRESWSQASDGPILYPEQEWEDKCIEGASVIEKEGKLFMFYAGAYNNHPQQIGVAVSSDGINWKRLSDAPFLKSGEPGSWNSSESGHPHIFKADSGKTYLFYQGNNTNGKNWFITNHEILWKNGEPKLKQ